MSQKQNEVITVKDLIKELKKIENKDQEIRIASSLMHNKIDYIYNIETTRVVIFMK